MKTFLILSILVFSAYSQGNLLRCSEQIGYTILSAAKFGIAVKSKDPKSAALAIKDIVGQIGPMINQCSNPICLDQAQKRCEQGTGKQCEQWGAIMYPKCAPGFKPFGCCLCVSECPPGFRDDGLFCAKPAPYGRGAGYPWKFGDGLNLNGAKNRCNAANQEKGCEKNGAIYYPKCAENFHNVGCCICSPNCPSSGMTDIGVSCTKAGTYGRGFGYPMYYSDCSKNSESKEQPSGDNEKLSYEQLQIKISELSEQLKQNKSNSDEASRIGQEMSDNLSKFDSQINN